MKRVLIFAGLTLALLTAVFPQTTKKPTAKKPTAAAKKTKTTPSLEEVSQPTPSQTPPKKNERPEGEIKTSAEPKKKNQAGRDSAQAKNVKIVYPYIYEFTQPNFIVSHIVIEHDEAGKGKITFEKKESSGDAISDPIQLTRVTLDRINSLLEKLNFLNSTEDYQSPTRDYGHLGNHKITVVKEKLERTAKYNWSENKDAKALAEEYRKIGEQYIWYFDMNISRENQPLEAPSMIERLESLLRRDEISDPPQMVPFLKELSIDERIPLMARNHVLRVIKMIEKTAEKKVAN